MKECPAPATRTGSPRRAAAATSSATSASLAGAAIRSGTKLWFPTQFVQPAATATSETFAADAFRCKSRASIDPRATGPTMFQPLGSAAGKGVVDALEREPEDTPER